MVLYITAFITGLLGSFHCIGMCGPIALALPTAGNSMGEKLLSRLLYNIGRILSYALLGILLGTFGWGLKLAGMQQSISIVTGVLIILTVLFASKYLEKYIGSPFRLLSGNTLSGLFRSKSYWSLFLIGVLNGLLPCGFIYIALIASVATQNSLNAALFMIFFGLGTLPLMFMVSVAGQFLSSQIRGRINRLTPVFAILIGCFFILRGMSLDIKYISPKIGEDKTVVKECCKPK